MARYREVVSSFAGVGESGTCLVLVDYDNAFPPGRRLSDEEIALEVGHWLQMLAARHPEVDRFEIRLYGGWYDESDLSRHGSEAARVITSLPTFPMSVHGVRILRGQISLAVNLLAGKTSAPLLGTYRRRGSLPRLQLSGLPYPDACAQIDSTCPAAILRSFTKHSSRACPVEACSLVASDAFVVHEQKMVDTLLATDILTACRPQSEYEVVVVVSGDSDFVPPLIAAKVGSDVRLVQLLPRAEEASDYATAVLTDVGVEIVEVSP